MPFVSKAQERKFREMERKGEMAAGTADKWLTETQDFEALPDRKNPKQPARAKRESPPTSPSNMEWYR